MRNIIRSGFWLTTLLVQLSCLDNSDLIQPDDVEKWVTIKSNNGLAGNEVFSLYEDSDGKIWMGTVYDGVTVYNGNSYTSYDIFDGLTDNTILAISEWEGFTVLGTFDGMSFFDGSDWYQLTAQQFGLSYFYVYSVLGDSNGNLWFGTDDGLWRADDTSTTDLYDFDCWECNWVNVLFEDSKGEVWAGTDGGLKKFNGNNYTLWDTSNGLKSNYVYSVYEDFEGNLWIGYFDSPYITKFDGSDFESYYLANDLAKEFIVPISQITQDRDGLFWIGLEDTGGLVQSDLNFFRSFNTENSDLTGNSITDIIRDRDGNIWVSTYFNGVSKYIVK